MWHLGEKGREGKDITEEHPIIGCNSNIGPCCYHCSANSNQQHAGWERALSTELPTSELNRTGLLSILNFQPYILNLKFDFASNCLNCTAFESHLWPAKGKSCKQFMTQISYEKCLKVLSGSFEDKLCALSSEHSSVYSGDSGGTKILFVHSNGL